MRLCRLAGRAAIDPMCRIARLPEHVRTAANVAVAIPVQVLMAARAPSRLQHDRRVPHF